MNRCLPLAGLDPFLGVPLEGERVHHESSGIQHVPSLDEAPRVGLDVGLLDGVDHDVPLWLVADASIVTAPDTLPVTFATISETNTWIVLYLCNKLREAL